MAQQSDIGLIGLAVMGENLALNFESKGFTVSLYNRSHPGQESVVTRFLNGRGKGKHFQGAYSIPEFVDSVRCPRKIMMMIKAGGPVDEVISQLLPYLSPGDILIDGGNSDFHDTERRVMELESKGFLFVGTGISGGEEGALNGPSIMPGGSPEAWPQVKPLLQAVAAKLDDGTPCCQWVGKGGAGHYVKMVHNGIEYGDMQLISEACYLLRKRLGLSNEETASVFDDWNRGELSSYLMEITADILRFRDSDHFLIDRILDVAGQKGTGKWSVMAALDESDPLTLITEAVYARFLSALKEEREKAHDLYSEEFKPDFENARSRAESVRYALYAAKLISYAQGFSLMRRASIHYGWDLDLAMLAQIWRRGCIIRSVFLEKITDAFRKNPELENLLFDEFFQEKIKEASPYWRMVAARCALNGVAVPCISAGLSYFDGLRTLYSGANLIQAQRDYFGAHTYERTDEKRGKFFHTDWTGKGGKTVSGNYTA